MDLYGPQKGLCLLCASGFVIAREHRQIVFRSPDPLPGLRLRILDEAKQQKLAVPPQRSIASRPVNPASLQIATCTRK
jgi:hypothetical protein